MPRNLRSCLISLPVSASGGGRPRSQARVINIGKEPNHEDIGLIERRQRGRYSEGLDGGVLSPYWDPVLQYFAGLLTASIKGQTPRT